MQQGANFSV